MSAAVPFVFARPAPLWRRLLAAAYDGLLVVGLALIGTLLLVAPLQLTGYRLPPWVEGAVTVGLAFAFFGWCWTHGGQTLGLRAWRLQVRLADGAAVRWPVAALRFAVGLALLGAGLWAYQASGAHAGAGHQPSRRVFQGLGWALGALAAGWLPVLADARRRALNDFVAGTEVVYLPPGAEPAPPRRRGTAATNSETPDPDPDSSPDPSLDPIPGPSPSAPAPGATRR